MKSDFLKELKERDKYVLTENEAIALKSTGDSVLDAFGCLGSSQYTPADIILKTFYAAFYENQELAMRLLFYVRDIRGGQGMRRVFRIIIRNLAITHPDLVVNNLNNFLFYGRGDDLFCLFDTPVEEDMMLYVLQTLNEDLVSVDEGGSCSLLAKWMPSINSSSKETRSLALRFIKYWKMSNRQYRRLLSKLRSEINIVEQQMSSGDWDTIDFASLPSQAAMRYSDAFVNHCLENYTSYLSDVAAGKAKINAGSLFPVDIVHNVMNSWGSRETLKNRILYEVLWKSLPNYFGDTEETGICVVDTSGSMYGKPIEVALSLGLYCADKAKGPFQNHFITFSNRPALQEIIGENIYDKMRNMYRADWSMNTNLEAVFDLILNTAIQSHMKQEDLPTKLYIISDMQFDRCVNVGIGVGSEDLLDYSKKPQTFIETMRKRYQDNGYEMPILVFWNVSSYEKGIYQLEGTDGQCCMVSGYSPTLFKSVIEGTDFVEEVDEESGETVVKQKIDPITVMERTLLNERYDRVFTGAGTE